MVQNIPHSSEHGITVVRADTSLARPPERAEYWNEVVRKHVIELECEAASNEELLCAMDGFSSSAGAATAISVGRLSVRRSAQAIDRQASDALILNLLIRGEMHVSQLGTRGLLTPGDFSICVADRPYELQIPVGMQVACFRVPVEHLGCNRELVNRLVAKTFSGENGMIPLVRAYALALWKRRLNLSHQTAETAMRQMSSLVGAVALEALQTGSSQNTEHRERLVLQAKLIVDRKLDDEMLSVSSVANEMRVSVRYLQRLWADEDESLAAYISDRRLARVAVSLQDCGRSMESLTQIAMSHGFVNMSHFSRTFRQKYGVPPRLFRQSPSTAQSKPTRSETPGQTRKMAGESLLDKGQ